jgi:phosphoglycerate dehydrogenase-like enzyme
VSTRVAILDDYQRVALSVGPWESLGDAVAVTAFDDHVADDDALIERLAPFEIVVAMRERTPFPRARLERLPGLKLLVTTGRANASIDMEAARELGIVVAGTGSLVTPTAELTWALILALCRNVVVEDAALRAGGWQHTIGPDLAGRTLGVLGLGRLGSRVATIAQAFEMDVIAWSQNLQAERAASLGVEAVGKKELFARADVLTIHLKLSERSRGLVGAAELGVMKPTAYLVNTSRGPIVDEAALLEALHAGTIAGAGLDVYDVEPLPADHPLRSAPRTVLTPHLGYVTTGNYELFFREVVDGIAGSLRGEPVNVI